MHHPRGGAGTFEVVYGDGEAVVDHFALLHVFVRSVEAEDHVQREDDVQHPVHVPDSVVVAVLLRQKRDLRSRCHFYRLDRGLT